ncbi:MAG: hypothetical protein ACI9GW_002947, partial [Halieaceae bacterium]
MGSITRATVKNRYASLHAREAITTHMKFFVEIPE